MSGWLLVEQVARFRAWHALVFRLGPKFELISWVFDVLTGVQNGVFLSSADCFMQFSNESRYNPGLII